MRKIMFAMLLAVTVLAGCKKEEQPENQGQPTVPEQPEEITPDPDPKPEPEPVPTPEELLADLQGSWKFLKVANTSVSPKSGSVLGVVIDQNNFYVGDIEAKNLKVRHKLNVLSNDGKVITCEFHQDSDRYVDAFSLDGEYLSVLETRPSGQSTRGLFQKTDALTVVLPQSPEDALLKYVQGSWKVIERKVNGNSQPVKNNPAFHFKGTDLFYGSIENNKLTLTNMMVYKSNDGTTITCEDRSGATPVTLRITKGDSGNLKINSRPSANISLELTLQRADELSVTYPA